jgi:hypothetical protein
MHAIFVSKKMLEGDPKFEKSLLDKAQNKISVKNERP